MTDHECKNLGENKIIPSASYDCVFWISWIVSYDTRFKDATHQVWINCKLNAEKLNHMKLQYLDFVNKFLLYDCIDRMLETIHQQNWSSVSME